MADEALGVLNNRSPLEAALTPNLDRITAKAKTGMIQTIPKGSEPVSETALANLLGSENLSKSNPRGPLEAMGLGCPVNVDQVALHFNFVHLFTDYQRLILADQTAGIEDDDEGRLFAECLQGVLGDEDLKFLHVSEYRGLMLWRNGPNDLDLTPTHEILGAEVKGFMPKGDRSRELDQICNSAQMVLANHPANNERRIRGKTVVNSIWVFGAGNRMEPENDFSRQWGLNGGLLTKSIALKGVASSFGMDVLVVADGEDTAHLWAETCVNYLEESDVLFVHIDAGDKAAHLMNAEQKVETIGNFDLLVGAIHEGLVSLGDYRMAILADHRTSPIDGQHSSAPVPLVLCGSDIVADRGKKFDERLLVRGSIRLVDGSKLMPCLLGGRE